MGKDQSTTQKHSSNLGVVLIAAAAGAIAGLLFAPKRGAETREDLKDKYNEVKNMSQDVAETARDKVNKGVETLRTKVHDTADKSEDAADKTLDKSAEKAKTAVSRIADDVQSTAERTTEHPKRDHVAM